MRTLPKAKSLHDLKSATSNIARAYVEGLESRWLFSGTGTSLGTAHPLGAVPTSGALHAAGTVGNANSEQNYSFSVSSIRDVTASIAGLSGNLQFQLIHDTNGNGQIDSGDVLLDSGYIGSGVSLHQRLEAGAYDMRVFNSQPNVNYTVSVDAPVAPPDPGNTLFTAKNLGAVGVSGAVSNSDWIGAADYEDDYSFTISSIRDVTASVSGLSGNLQFQLIQDSNSNGQIDSGDVLLDSGYIGGSTALHQRLEAGTYYVRVFNSQPDTFYTVSVTAPSAPADPGNTIFGALDLGAVSPTGVATHSDWIGAADYEDDYSFTTTSIRDVTASVANLSGDLQFQLIRDSNGNGQIDSGDVVADSGYIGGNSSIHQRLEAGTYYVRVFNSQPDVFYSLSVIARTAPADPGNSLLTALNLGALAPTAVATHNDWIGNADYEDDYSFSTTSIRDVTASVSGLSGDLQFQLIRDSNGNGQIDSGDVVADSGYVGGNSSIHQRLEAGTYYVRVFNSQPDTFYTVSVIARTAPADPGNTLATAEDLGKVSGVVTVGDWIGNADPVDFYKFQTGATGNVAASISGLSGDLQFQVIRDANKNGQIDSGDVIADSGYIGGSTSLNLSGLAAGSYYVSIFNSQPDTFYTLTLVTPSVVQAETVSIAATDSSAAFSPADPGVFTITRAGSTATALTVNYTIGGTAVNGTDYQKIAASVIIPVGKTSATVTISPIAGSKPKSAESAILTLAAGSGYSVGSGKSATVNILGNNVPALGLLATDPTAADTVAGPTSSGDLTLSRSGSVVGALTVSLNLSGSAVYARDFTLVVYGASSSSFNAATKTLTLTIASGVTGVSIVVTPLISKVAEPAETVILSLISSANFSVRPGNAAGTVTIAAHPA